MDFLSDTWAIEGKEYDEFKEQLEKFEKQTSIKEIPMDEFSFLSISDMGVGYMAYHEGYRIPELPFCAMRQAHIL